MERINLGEHRKTRLRAWAFGNPSHWQYREAVLGQLDDGRWFVSRIGRGWSGAWLARDERQACEAVESWMRRDADQWRETPARFGADGQPSDGRTWWQSGSMWMPGERPDSEQSKRRPWMATAAVPPTE
jgi:hypothetical protein